MLSLESLTHATFAPLVGQTFIVHTTEGTFPLQLAAASLLGEPHPGSTRDPFALTFHGPSGLLLPQRIYRLSCQALGDDLEIFITQIGNKPAAAEFEAIFT